MTGLFAALCLGHFQKVVHLEVAQATLVGVQLHRAGAQEYLTNFVDDNASASWKFQAKAGIYEVRINYGAPMGGKGFGLKVDGEESGGMFSPTKPDVFSFESGGLVELHDGPNTLAIERGWGYFNIGGVDLIPAKIDPTTPKPPDKLCDPDATVGARRLFSNLVKGYGSRCLSGQYGIEDASAIQAVTGQSPAILGDDFIDYSPSRIEHGAKPEGGTEKVIAAERNGYAITMSWHWNAPSHLKDTVLKDAAGHDIDAHWYKGFYTNATDFDLAAALEHPDSKDYSLLLRDIDAISGELAKFAKAGIPVLWRPLHEAEGGWFWWGAKGAEPFKKLWRLMYDRMTHLHGLHNLIWVYSSGTDSHWYPGDDCVDVVGIDAYPSSGDDALTTTWQTLEDRFAGKKPLAISEFGGVPNVTRMRKFGVRWAYFVSWGGTDKPPTTSEERLRAMYRSPFVDNRSKRIN